jgi:hypothetical protein
MKSMKMVATEIREGKSVLLFPEGHRSRDGQLLPFKAGSFYIAILWPGFPLCPSPSTARPTSSSQTPITSARDKRR